MEVQTPEIVDDAEMEASSTTPGATEGSATRNKPAHEDSEGVSKAAETAAEQRGQPNRRASEPDAGVYSEQLHIDATMARADEQLTQIVDAAEMEAYDPIPRANEKADSNN